MRPDGVVVLNVLFHDIRNLTLVYCEEIIQRFVSNGFHEPLGDRVHVRCFDRCRNAANAVERIVEQKLLSVVVNEIDWTIDEMLELDELLTHEFARRNLCHGDSGDLTSFVPDYEEYIEPLAEYRVDSKEIHGKDRINLRRQKLLPCHGFSDFSLTSENLENSADSFLVKVDTAMKKKLISDALRSPRWIAVFYAENKFFNYIRNRWSTGMRFMCGKSPERGNKPLLP